MSGDRRPWLKIVLPPITMGAARALAGAGAFALTVAVLWMIYAKPELADNDLFKSLAQALVIQGLIGLVMAFMFTGRNTGEDRMPPPRDAQRAADQVADAADREAEQIAGERE